jgi:DNA topoisomerase-3
MPQQTGDLNYAKGKAITVLHLAEKPSIAQAIAQGIAQGSANYRSKALSVHEITDPAPFCNDPKASHCHHRVTFFVGHV